MNTLKKFVIAGVLCALTAVFAQFAFAQGDGYIEPLGKDNGGLPPGAVYENGIVSHPISSAEENLHLLAGYYYRNPREWKRIYNDNRNVIRNPNSLPVGQTLHIHVGENWKPLFSYEEWFRLANRNGQWKAGQPWKPARVSSGTRPSTPPAPAGEPKPKQAAPPPAPLAPEPKPELKAPTSEPVPPAQAQPAAPEEPTAAEEEPPPPEETPEPEEEEAAPAF